MLMFECTLQLNAGAGSGIDLAPMSDLTPPTWSIKDVPLVKKKNIHQECICMYGSHSVFHFFNLPKNFSETQVSFLIMLTAVTYFVSVVFQASPPILEPTTALAIYSRMSSSLVPCNHLFSRHATLLEETSCLVIQICGRNYCLLDKVDVGLAKK